MATINLKINAAGQPVVPDQWICGGGLGTTDTRNAVDPGSGAYIKLSEIQPNGDIVLHDPPAGWRDTPMGRAINFVAQSSWTPYNLADLWKLFQIVGGVPVPIQVPTPQNPPNTSSVVPGRTMAQAQAMGDVWGFTHDPATDPR